MTDIQATAAGLPPYPIQPKLDIMQTARTTWVVFKRQPWRFIWLVFLIPLLVTLPFSFAQGAIGALFKDNRGLVLTVTAVALLVQYVTQFTCQLGGLWGAARNMEGGRFTTMEAIKVGFSRLLPYVGLVVLALLIVGVGVILLVIPGIALMGFLGVAGPACVIERRGPIDSIKRSFALVTDNWWRSFATILLVLFVPLLAYGFVAAILYAVVAALDMKVLASIIVAIPSILFFLVFVAIAAILPAVLFMELRAVKEGRTSGHVAGVFE